jgi:hypothetical protein
VDGNIGRVYWFIEHEVGSVKYGHSEAGEKINKGIVE